MTDWPASLPQLLVREGLALAFGENRVSFQPDQGAPLQRRLGTAGPDEVAGQMVLDSDQFATFSTFFKTTLKQGTLPFTWTHPVTGAAATVKIMGKPQFGAIGGGAWRLELQLLLLP